VATFATAMIVYSSALMATSSFASAETTLIRPKMARVGDLDEGAEFHAQGPVRQDLLARRAPGNVTLLTFLDPRCWTDCPLLAQQLKVLRADLPTSTKLDIVAVAADPYHEQLSDLRHFIAIRGLTHVKNFYFVTGKLATVKKVWASYGIGVSMTKSDVDEHPLGLYVHHQCEIPRGSGLSPTIRFPVRRVRPPPCPNCASYSPTKASAKDLTASRSILGPDPPKRATSKRTFEQSPRAGTTSLHALARGELRADRTQGVMRRYCPREPTRSRSKSLNP